MLDSSLFTTAIKPAVMMIVAQASLPDLTESPGAQIGINAVLVAVVYWMMRVIDDYRQKKENGKADLPINKVIHLLEELNRKMDGMPEVTSKVRELWGWHNVPDPSEPGAKAWWITGSIRKQLSETHRNIERLLKQTKDSDDA